MYFGVFYFILQLWIVGYGSEHASVAHSSSKLKMMKSHLRSSVRLCHLSGIAILSIKNVRAHDLEILDLIDSTVKRKAGKTQ